jgi:hypothetical protein
MVVLEEVLLVLLVLAGATYPVSMGLSLVDGFRAKGVPSGDVFDP